MALEYKLDARITSEQKRRLDEAAIALDIKPSEVVRRLLDQVRVEPALVIREN